MRTPTASYLFILCCFFSFSSAQEYSWPLYPVLERYCRGTFCEYRSGHFHEGIDIPASGSFTVYATTDTFKYIGNSWNAEDQYIVTVQHYTQSGSSQWPLDEGSRYIHMYNINTTLSEGEIYVGEPLAVNTGFLDIHLHFEMRWPAPVGVSGLENIFNAYNPFIKDNLCPDDPDDDYKPVLDYLYADGDVDHQGNATINSWNFLGYDFMNYYDSTTVSPFIRLTLPTESSGNDLDDPHIMISGNCKVRFILKAKDEVTSGYPNCAPYSISLFFADQIPCGEDELYDPEKTPFHQVKFDELENEFGQNETYDEEDVYHTESPLVSDQSTFYYRLYPHDKNGDGYPDCIINPSRYLSTEGLQNGQYPIRIVVTDYEGNTKTADVHFYVRKQNWVDYCRAFNY